MSFGPVVVYGSVFGSTFESAGADDVDKTVQLVLDNGGSIIRAGRLAAVADSTGAAFNLSSLDQ